MANTEPGQWAGLRCRRLKRSDIPEAQDLSREASWNQTPDDWDYMIAQGHGWGLFDDAGRLAATALTLPKADSAFGWVSMVLVTKAWQRHGLATRLLEKCIESLLDDGRTPGLDATEAGRPLYLPLGFRDVYSLTRMARAASTEKTAGVSPGIRAVQVSDQQAILARDRIAAGCDRTALLSHLLTRAPQMAWMHQDGAGYCYGRDGADAVQIGPVVASHDQAAIDLVGGALTGLAGPVFIDVPDHKKTLIQWLTSIGFRPQRRFVRMLLGRDRPFDDPAKTYAIAGPELG